MLYSLIAGGAATIAVLSVISIVILSSSGSTSVPPYDPQARLAMGFSDECLEQLSEIPERGEYGRWNYSWYGTRQELESCETEALAMQANEPDIRHTIRSSSNEADIENISYKNDILEMDECQPHFVEVPKDKMPERYTRRPDWDHSLSISYEWVGTDDQWRECTVVMKQEYGIIWPHENDVPGGSVDYGIVVVE